MMPSLSIILSTIITIIIIIFQYVLQFLGLFSGAIGGFNGASNEHFNAKIVIPENNNNILIIFISGLGNGKESFNWNLASEEIKNKTNLHYDFSLQDDLSSEYITMSFDPPGYGDNIDYEIPSSAKEYCELIHEYAAAIEHDHTIVVGHSIGALIAQLYANIYGAELLMLDPTPLYLLREIKYTKHIENPGIVKYANTAKFLQMCKDSHDVFSTLSYASAYIIYSDDDDDPDAARKVEYFSNLHAQKIACGKNYTHFLHITNPDVVKNTIVEIMH